MTTRQLPFMSVVICVWNGADKLGYAIESLLAQDYPKDRYEIIVVNDGSADRSLQVAQSYPVRVINHAKNQGLPAARNTGLAHARGDIYVCFDHDCVVEPGWLRQLATGYELPDAKGVGSIVAPHEHIHGWVDHFMVATGSGNPPSLKLGTSPNPLKRFLAYIADQFGSSTPTGTQPYAVRQLNGASATFPVSVLQAVGGWDASLRWMEDSDICSRINQLYPSLHYYALPTARLVHDPKMSLRTFITRPYKRGLPNLKYYRRNHLVPPIFPMPVAWILATLGATLLNPALGLLTAILSPQLLYAWWPYKGARQLRPLYFSFAYLQLAEEASTVLGLLSGYVALMGQGSEVRDER